jgi:hypothetical protein
LVSHEIGASELALQALGELGGGFGGDVAPKWIRKTIMVEPANGAVGIYSYRWEKGRIALSVNRSDRMQTVRIGGFAAASVLMVPDNVSAPVTGNTVTAVLPPWGVNIYVEGQLPPPVGQLPALRSEWEKDNLFCQAAERRHRENGLFVPYNGGGSWIWAADAVHTSGSATAAVKILDLAQSPKAAEIMAAADDSCRIFVNGKLLGGSDSWNKMARIDLTAKLRPGKNIVVIEGRDAGGLPCGLLGRLTVDNQVFVTGNDWLVSSVFDPARFGDTATFAAWRPATVIAPYGGGVWGRGVKVRNK